MLVDVIPRLSCPPGPVVADLRHPILGGAAGAILLSGPRSIDLLHPSEVVTYNGSPAQAVGMLGRGLKCPSANDFLSFPSASFYQINGDVPFSFTVIWYYPGSNGSISQGLISFSTTNNGSGAWKLWADYGSTNNWWIGITSTFTDTGLAAPSTAGVYVTTVTRAVGGSWAIYQNNASSTWSDTTSSAAGAQILNIGTYSNDRGTNCMGGAVFFGALLHNRILLRSEHIQLWKEPFCWVRPVLPVWAMSAGLVGSGTRPMFRGS